MARNNFLGGFYRGKLGDSIGQVQHSAKYVRQYFRPTNPRSPLQQANRNGFAYCTAFVSAVYQGFFSEKDKVKYNYTYYQKLIKQNRPKFPPARSNIKGLFLTEEEPKNTQFVNYMFDFYPEDNNKYEFEFDFYEYENIIAIEHFCIVLFDFTTQECKKIAGIKDCEPVYDPLGYFEHVGNHIFGYIPQSYLVAGHKYSLLFLWDYYNVGISWKYEFFNF
jgi:hypothetical protein